MTVTAVRTKHRQRRCGERSVAPAPGRTAPATATARPRRWYQPPGTRGGSPATVLSPIRRLPSTGNRKPYSMAARPSTIQHSWPDPPPHPYSFVLTASRVLDSGPVTHQDLGEDGSGIRKDSPLPCLRPRRASCAPQKNFGSRPCPFAFYTQVQWLTPGRVSRPVRVHGQGGVPPRRAFSCGGTGAFQSSYQPSRLTKPTGSAARPPILS